MGLFGKKKATRENTIVLFDVDGTLTVPRKEADPAMIAYLKELRKVVTIGIVGGSDLAKQKEQLGLTLVDDFDWVFSENGLVGYEQGKLFHEMSFVNHLGEEKLQKLTNFLLRYMADIELPCKRGTFVEFRKGMLNVSPIGRQCSQAERDDYEKFDLANGIRKKMVAALEAEFAGYNLKYSIGGQISFDLFPQGWDKTYCLRHIEGRGFSTVHFFGDKTMVGGNDWEIYNDKRTKGHAVQTWQDTVRICKELFPETA